MIILTGGAGFIGSAFLSKLNQEGISDVIVVDHLGNTEKWRNLSNKKFLDYVEKDDFLELVKSHKLPRPKSIVHMGACSSTTCTDASYFVKNNYQYSKTLAEWALTQKTSFLYASSAATYGDGSLGYSDSDESTFHLQPLNVYGWSKHIFDLWVLNNKLTSSVTGLKFFNVFGPNEYHKEDMRSVVCKAFPQVRDEGKMKLFKSYKNDYADGEQKRDFIYIKDAVNVMYYFLTNPKKTGIFNLGTGKARSWNDMARAIFSAMGKKTNIEYIEMPQTLKEKYQYFTEADMSKLEGVGCDYEFQSLEDSVKDYVEYLAIGKIL